MRFWIALIGLAMVVCADPTPCPAQQRPNIILINLDDADSAGLSDHNILARFPHMSRFVTDGLRFTNFHVTSPLCGPSRASLLRGQYAHRTGILINELYIGRQLWNRLRYIKNPETGKRGSRMNPEDQ